MSRVTALDALMDNFQNFDIGKSQSNFLQDKSDQLIKSPVERYSYALVRAGLNVFVQHGFADNLNSLAFDRDNFGANVQMYVPHVWPHYLEVAQTTLPTAKISQLCDLEFKDWGHGGTYRFGAWHHLAFPEFQINVLLEVSNGKGRLGAFEGTCYCENDKNTLYRLPANDAINCHNLGPLHLQLITDEMLEALGIAPESAISAIKWQMRQVAA
jgi:hypothetical protein